MPAFCRECRFESILGSYVKKENISLLYYLVFTVSLPWLLIWALLGSFLKASIFLAVITAHGRCKSNRVVGEGYLAVTSSNIQQMNEPFSFFLPLSTLNLEFWMPWSFLVYFELRSRCVLRAFFPWAVRVDFTALLVILLCIFVAPLTADYLCF